ncbi:MAG: HAD hydrolase family protein [Actinomycetota bacterium]
MPSRCLTSNGVDKGSSLGMIAAEFGDARSEVAAIGDDANGIPMLARAHTGVVMGQATEHVKAVAQHTTGTNEDDGLALGSAPR